MEVHFTQEQEAQLAQLARRDGKGGAGDLLKDAGLRLLDEEARFRATVLEGKAYADRGSSSGRKRWTVASNRCCDPEWVFAGRRPPRRTCRTSATTPGSITRAIDSRQCASCTRRYEA